MNPITFYFPLPRTHCGIVMGNGNFGALVWGRKRIHLTINRSDFWDRRHEAVLMEGMAYARMKAAFEIGDGAHLSSILGEGMTRWRRGRRNATAAMEQSNSLRKKGHGEFRPSRLPMGRFELVLKPGFYPQCGELDPGTGRLRLKIKNRHGKFAGMVLLVMHTERNVLLVYDSCQFVGQVLSRPAWEWVESWLRSRGFAPPTLIKQKNLTGWIQACPADPAMAALCRHAGNSFLISMEKGTTTEAAQAAGIHNIEACKREGRRISLAANDRWWRAYWRRAPEVRLPSAFFQKYFTYALYKFACATNPNGNVPAGLQGPWVEEYQPPPWGGDYHFNVNIQQIYTLAFAIGQMDHCLPLFDMLDSWRDVLRRNARVLLDIDDGFVMGMCTTDRGQLLYYGAGCILDQAVAGWTAQLYWLYYRYTGDLVFLRQRAYPFMLGVLRAYAAMLEDKNGRLSLPLSISAEYASKQGQHLGRDPSSQLACIHMLIDALAEAGRCLGLKPDPIWRKIKTKLPLYTLVGDQGQERIAVWHAQDLTQCHRHHSHLSCIYPFDSLGKLTPEKQAILDNSIDHWISKGMGQWSEWCIPWAAILQARMGFTEAPMVLMNMWREIFVNEGLATVYLPKFRGITAHRRADMLKPKKTHEVMQLDGTMAAATVLIELLVHQRAGVTHVFPAVPEAWRDVAFRNIRVPGPFLVSAEKKDGVVTRVKIKSVTGGKLRIVVHGIRRMVITGNGKTNRIVTFPITLSLRPGEYRTMLCMPKTT